MCQSPLSMGFSRQEYWSGLPSPPPGNLPNGGIEPESPALQVDSLPLSHWGSPKPRVAIDNCKLLPWGKRYVGFPGGSDVKESACNVGDLGSIPGSGRSPGEGHGNPLQYSCLENPLNRGAWWAMIHGITKSQTQSWKRIIVTTAKSKKNF